MIYSKVLLDVAPLLVLLPVLLPMMSYGQRGQENLVPLKNWAAPLRWRPNRAEREAAGKPVPQLQFSPTAVSADALTFVAITPCRLVDTRGIVGGFNGGISPFAGPYIPAGGSATIPVQDSTEATANTAPAPCGVIPNTAEAYSFNLTVVPAAAGGVNYVTLWPAGASQPVVSTLNDTQGAIVANAAIVPAGTGSGGVSVYNAGPAPANVIIDMNGFYAAPTDIYGDTAVGYNSLQSNTTGFHNTAFGNNALSSNTTGEGNTALGFQALQNNVIGIGNIAIGAYAGGNFVQDYNIDIGNSGEAGDSGAIRIGHSGNQDYFFAAGIRGSFTLSADAIPVVIDSNGQLGTISSSRRLKEDIEDMGGASSGLLRLRPVTFRYRRPYADGSKPIEYGLIAEEVGEVYPDLVAHSADGQIETVKYQVLDSMLLNELQKQHAQVETQNQRAQQQDEIIRQLQARLAELEEWRSSIQTSEVKNIPVHGESK